MRIVTGPEKIVRAIDGCGQHAGTVILISKENIFLKVFARRQLINVPVGIESALATEPIIDLLYQVGDPADVELRADDFELRVTVEDAGGALVVHLGNSDFLDRYRIYVRHVNDWRVQFQKLQSVDLRFNGQIIVNPDTRDERVTATPSMY